MQEQCVRPVLVLTLLAGRIATCPGAAKSELKGAARETPWLYALMSANGLGQWTAGPYVVG